MSTSTIFFFALGVFALMITGILLTMWEFYRLTDDPSTHKGAKVKENTRVQPVEQPTADMQ